MKILFFKRISTPKLKMPHRSNLKWGKNNNFRLGCNSSMVRKSAFFETFEKGETLPLLAGSGRLRSRARKKNFARKKLFNHKIKIQATTNYFKKNPTCSAKLIISSDYYWHSERKWSKKILACQLREPKVGIKFMRKLARQNLLQWLPAAILSLFFGWPSFFFSATQWKMVHVWKEWP